jgi:PKD repeat protein
MHSTDVGLLNGLLRILIVALLAFPPVTARAEPDVANPGLQWLSPPTATPAIALPQQLISFSALAGAEAAYAWDFGDGCAGTGASVSHAYASFGTYVATVRASGETGACSGSVTVVVAGIQVTSRTGGSSKRAPTFDPSYALNLGPLESPSVAPFTRLTLTVSGLTSGAYTTVRFMTKQQTFEVAGANMGSTVIVSVPPFVSKKKFARATVLMQVAQGAKLSNPVKLAISDIPKVQTAPGRYVYSFLRTFRTMTRTARTALASGSYGTTSNLADVDELIGQYASLMSYVSDVGGKAAEGTLSSAQKKFDLPVLKELDRLIAGLLHIYRFL